jgi:shikimate dehydrogenase
MKNPMFDPEIYARSKLLIGLIGSGIRRSLAPVIQECEAEHHGLHLHYQIIDSADPAVLPQLLDAAKVMGFAGLNITFPFKQAVLPLLDEIDPAARAMNAVNCVTIRNGKLSGYNTDGAGWAWGFQRMMPRADLSRVVLRRGFSGGACGAGHGRAKDGAGRRRCEQKRGTASPLEPAL